MPQKPAYEAGARQPMQKKHPDPNDAFSQDAAGNKPPKSGMGITEKVDEKGERGQRPGKKEGSTEPQPAPRDTGESPTPNPNDKQPNKKPA